MDTLGKVALTLIGGYEKPGCNVSAREQVRLGISQLQPAPPRLTTVEPAGGVSVTLIAATEGSVEAFDTIMLQTAGAPRESVPVWVTRITRLARFRAALPLADAFAPVVTKLADSVTVAGAEPETFTFA